MKNEQVAFLYFSQSMNIEKRRGLVSLSDQCRDIILGSLLGDGSLKMNAGYANARFSFRHSSVQKDYFNWKVEMLSEISSNVHTFVQKPDGYSKNEKLRYQSAALSVLTDIFKLTCKGGKLNIRRKWLNIMQPLSLAIWWQDDGSIIGGGRKGVLCTDGFDEKSVHLLAQYLQNVWGVYAHVGKIGPRRDSVKTEYFRLWLGTEELKKFLRIILPHIHKSMIKKVYLKYKDPELQQRWISEIKSATGFSDNDIVQPLWRT